MSNLCVYCKSGAFGPGCPFSPHGIHVHPGDAKRCLYCGSYSIGPGCPYNPHGKNHVHGIDYNQMINSSVENSIVTGYLIDKLNTPITEMNAYKIGLIDKQGNKIKKANTIEEKAALSILDQYVIDLKQALGPKIDMINSSTYLQIQQTIPIQEYASIYEKELAVAKQIKHVIKELKDIFHKSYQSGLSSTVLEKLIIEAFDSSVD